jgi:hypothetical protein
LNVLPQLQVTLISAYSGWIEAFMVGTALFDREKGRAV